MFTEKDLIAGETVLIHKNNPANKNLYLGSAGLVHFVSHTNDFECANNNNFRIQELNQFYTIEQPKSKVVPLEKKVYDFVPVRVRDSVSMNWRNAFLIAVTPLTDLPFKTVDEDGYPNIYKYCEFLNEQP